MKHSEIRGNIIQTASFLFYKNGYNSTGINEIISESGIAKATLYNHFRSKEDICLAYLEFKNETFQKDIREFCTSKPKGDKQLLALFDYLTLFFKDKDFNGCWCIKTVTEIPKEDEKIRSEIQSQKNELIDFIRALITSNEITTNDEAKSLAYQIYLLYECAVGESHLHQSDWPIKEAKDMCKKIIQ